MALDDVLSRFRPTHTAKDQLMALYSQITAVALGVATLSDYPFFEPSVFRLSRPGRASLRL